MTTTTTEGLFAPDVFADITLPQWRVQDQGREFPAAARGYTLKVEEWCEESGQR